MLAWLSASRGLPALLLAAIVVAATTVPAAAQEDAGGDSLLARADRALVAGDFGRVEELLEEARPMVDDGRIELRRSRLAFAREDHDAAIEHARSAVRRDRRNAEYHLALAYAYGLKASRGGMSALFYAGKFKGACEKAVECDPENVEAHFAVLQYYLMAPGFAGGGGERVQETIRTIESLDPFYGHLARGLEAWAAEDAEGAERRYLAAAHVDTMSAEGWGALGIFYMEQARYADAIPVGERILELEPGNLEAVYALAKARLLADEDLDAAAAGFTRYIEEGGDPRGATEAEARWRLGMVYDRVGRPVEAHAQWERAIDMDPELERAVARLDSIEAAHPELR